MRKLGWVTVMKLTTKGPTERIGDRNHRAMPSWHHRSALLLEKRQAVSALLIPPPVEGDFITNDEDMPSAKAACRLEQVRGEA